MPTKRRIEPPMERLLASLDEAFSRQSWHGPNLLGALKGLSADEAVWRPAPGRHNVQEILIHTAYWKYVVRRKITGAGRGSFPLAGRNFFPREAADAALLRADLRLLRAQHEELREAVGALRSRDLGRRVARRDLGWMIRGAAAHDIYHAGQIRLVRRLRRSGE